MIRQLAMAGVLMALAAGGPKAAEPATATESSTMPLTLTVALLPLTTQDPAMEEPAGQLRDVLEFYLGAAGNLRIVERAEIDRILKEQQLGLAGLTAEQAPRVGKLLGAQALVMGRLFVMQGQWAATTRLVGVESGQSYSSMARQAPGELELIAEMLSTSISQHVRQHGAELGAVPKLYDRGQVLRHLMVRKTKPKVFVHVAEQHAGAPLTDPAAQTELERMLLYAGFEVVKDRQGPLAKWAAQYLAEGGKTAPPATDGVQLVLIGEGISQLGARNGDMVSCRARVEMQAIDAATGKLLASESDTGPGVDLAEAIAAKTALQEAGGRAGMRVLVTGMQAWTAAHPDLAKPERYPIPGMH